MVETKPCKLLSIHWSCPWQRVVLLCLVGLAVNQSIRADEFESISGRAMGTSYYLKYSGRGLTSAKDELAKELSLELERLESIFSLYRAESEISRLNAAPAGEWIQVSTDLFEVAKCAAKLCQQTGGAFDPTLRPLMELWQSDQLAGAWTPPSPTVIAATLRTVGVSHWMLQVEPPAIQKDSKQVRLDLNALVEGWTIKRVLELLKLKGCTRALFELGGEYGALGCKSASESWQIGIENPKALSEVYATLSLCDEALCTSGVYRQSRRYAGKRYAHIIDPRTGYPVQHDCLSVSVLHNDALIADGWATALMVLGPVEGVELADKLGLAASFACGTDDVISPKVSKQADGRLTLAPMKITWQAQAWQRVLVIAVICSAGLAWRVFLKRRRWSLRERGT
jgi:thiamine biosynthesis lipoprotein